MSKNIEIWKPVVGYEGFYEVSNLGNVRSLDKMSADGRRIKGKILTHYLTEKGYLRCFIYDKQIKIHRLVAQAFLPNPNNYPEVNHKDENKQNNMVWVNEDGSIDYDKSNLEWCNHSQNIRHSRGKTIIQYDSKGKFLREWKNLATIEEQLKYNKSNICNVCKGIRKTAHGFIWKYKEEKAV